MSDIPLDVIEWISALPTWDGVKIGLAKRFCDACGFDPMNSYHRKCANVYVRKVKSFKHITRSPYFNTQFRPIIEKLREAGYG